MLRLKGERDDDALRDDEGRSRPAYRGQTEEITRDDAFPDAEEARALPDYQEYDSGRPGRALPLRGLAVAAGTFVPTFLLIFLGLPYLFDSSAPARTPTAPAPAKSLESESSLTPRPSASVSEALREEARRGLTGRVTGDLFSPSPPTPREPPPGPKAEDPAPPIAVEPAPSLPPARASQPEPARAPEPRAPEAPRQVASPPPPEPRASEARPAPEAPRASREWTPAAAFTDRAAAGRLASSIEKQGYPVEIRQDGSSARPWVVWIGAQPSGGSRRR